MQQTISRTEWKPKEITGNHSTAGHHQVAQRQLSIHAEAPPAQVLVLLPAAVVQGATFSNVLAFAVQGSGMDDAELAEQIHISPGYMSKFIRGVGEQWARRPVLFMRKAGTLGPLQWMAAQVGCEVVQLDARAAEVAALQARLNELQRVA